MTEKKSNCEGNSIKFGDFTREDIDKIMINEGYEKSPDENEWIYKPKDKTVEKQLFLPRNKGRLEKEKDDIINNIKNKGLNPNARDFVPKSKEKTNNNYNGQATPFFTQVYYNNYFVSPYSQSYIPPTYQTPYIMMTPTPYNYPQEGMMPMNANQMKYDMENSQTNNPRLMPVYVPMQPSMIPSNMSGKMNGMNKTMIPLNEKFMNENAMINNNNNNNSNNNSNSTNNYDNNTNALENKVNQDVIIDIDSSNEDVTEIPENEEDNDEKEEKEKEEVEVQPKEDEKKEKKDKKPVEIHQKEINIQPKEKEEGKEIKKENKTNDDQKQSSKKKKNNAKAKLTSEENPKPKTPNDPSKNKGTLEDTKVKPVDATQKTKETKEPNKNSYASKVMENTTNHNKKKPNDKKKANTKVTKETEGKDMDVVKEEENKKENEVKEVEKEVKTEETVTVVTEEEKKEEKKEEVKKEEVKKEETKPKLWSSLFSKEDTKSNASTTKTSKAKTITTKTIPKSQTNANEPVNLIDKIKISFEQVPIQPRGLINNGNMCFMNAILQPLLYCPPFYNFIYSLKKETVHGINKPSIIESMIMFFDEFKVVKKKDLDVEDYGESFLPEYVYNALRKYNSTNSLQGRQEDAEEYLGFLLNGIHDEFISKYSKPSSTPKKSDTEGWTEVGPKNKLVVTREAEIKESPINKIFGGRIKSILKCPGNKKNSATIEPFLSLQLDITPDNVSDIEDALENLTVPEIVPDYSVNGNKVSATKQNVIDGLPNVLLLHLKCFTFDHNTTQKVQKTINFKSVLEIKPELLSPSLKSHAPYTYNLFAVVNHHGKMAGGGHYTCNVKQCNDRWLNFDDTKIKQTNELEVTTPNKNQLPYLLLYTLDQKK